MLSVLNSASLTSPTCVTNGYPQCVRYAEVTEDAFTATHARLHAVLCYGAGKVNRKSPTREGSHILLPTLEKAFSVSTHPSLVYSPERFL